MDNEPLNIVTVNGKEYWVDCSDSFYDMLSDIGIRKEDADAYRTGRDENYAVTQVDGVTGDDYYIFIEEIDRAIQEVRDEIDNLNSNRRKNNTKLEIAHRLAMTMDNLENFIH